MRCHDEAPVTPIFKTRHANRADPHSPFAQEQCETCHGPGAEHAQRLHEGDPRPPIGRFAKGSRATVSEQNAVCLSCHSDNNRVGWHGSVHERKDLACVSCHKIHSERDPVRETATQPQVCYACHAQARADFDKFSAHPVRDGDLKCTSCHAPHDSLYPALLAKPTLNQTCYTCHAQMRGPFLWEHAPVAEDCSNCHVPHGSVNPALLKLRPPLLCQQCHAPAGHPSIAYTGQGLPGRTPSGFLLAGSCTNCHSHVHGSNAPSGADLSR
jgi:DmsE family decaheme c-type cytochrome